MKRPLAASDFWGKLQRKDGAKTGPVEAWHPLVDHCADVAAVTEALLTHTLLGKRLARLASLDSLSETQIARLSVIAALHDIGKFNHGFQRKGFEPQHDLAGHVVEGLSVLNWLDGSGAHTEAAHQLFPIRDWGAWAVEDGFTRLWVAAICHHGTPIALHEAKWSSALWEPDDGRRPYDGCEQLVEATKHWFAIAYDLSSPNRDLLPVTPPFAHAFAGVVMLADWLGSDTRFFSYTTDDDPPDRMLFARPKAREALESIGIVVEKARTTMTRPEFSSVFGNEPRSHQAHVASLSTAPEGTLTILEAETGSGKTEAALMRFFALFQAGQVDGMYFALPTRTAATQIHKRVVRAVEKVFVHEESRPPVVMAVPGYLAVDDVEGKRLPHFKVLWHDDERRRFRYRGWAAEHPKRFLSATIAVGTIDQTLLSSLRVSHSHLRASSLLRQLLVVDEVHASDVYMTTVLREVLKFHLDAGGHALLMSATLAESARAVFERLINPRRAALSLSAAKALPYPRVWMQDAKRSALAVERASEGVQNPWQKKVGVTLAPIAEDFDGVAKAALQAASTGARVLIVRNTVSACLDTQLALERACPDGSLLFRASGVNAPHHARYAKADRTTLDHAIEAVFGKDAPARVGPLELGVVLCATQTVQQSLDLDADVMFTDLCPMDVLLQRIGRVHRHRGRDRSRPVDYAAIAKVTVLVPNGELLEYLWKNGEAHGPKGSGIGTVYSDLLILESTLRTLRAQCEWEIPRDNRTLVEAALHPESLSLLHTQKGSLWSKHFENVSGKTLANTQQGQFATVVRYQVDMRSKVDSFGEFSFKADGELQRRVSTRLGESDRVIECVTPFDSPFGNSVKTFNVAGWLARDFGEEPKVVVTKTSDGVSKVMVDDIEFRYDRLGLQRISVFTSKSAEDASEEYDV